MDQKNEMNKPAFFSSKFASWFEPVDIHSLVLFRILLGSLVAILIVYKYFWLGLLERYYVYPSYNFSYYGFSWVKPVPETGMYLVFVVMLISAIGVALGVFYRVSAFFLWLTWTYVFLCDKAVYQNHHYLVSLITFWMIFIPANGLFSVDAEIWKQVRREKVPAWMLWTIRLLIALPYVYGAFAKMNPDWLLAKPTWIWVQSGSINEALPEFLKSKATAWFMAYYGLFFDLLVVPALLWGRTRLLACLAILAFHVSNSFLFHIGLFPWMMLLSTVLFFPPDFLPGVIGALRGTEKFDWSVFWRTETGSSPKAKPGPTKPFGFRQKLTIFALLLFFGFQFLFPLRHWVYEGNPSWNGKGDLFAWRMMLDDKRGTAEFLIRDNSHKQEYIIKTLDPDHPVKLSIHQQLSMTRLPDMVLQYAHYLEKEYVAAYNRRGGGTITPADVSVYANVMNSLNGRPAAPLINPKIDLTEVKRTLFEGGEWLLPLPKPEISSPSAN